jgi:3',5'-cyclic AMP phosphodiesterase CpdA
LSAELTTVGSTFVVVHDGTTVWGVHDLEPDRTYELHGMTAHTLSLPSGQLRCRIGTVNDVHFGEDDCGRVSGHEGGPVLRSGPDEPPHPQIMNDAAAAEMRAADLDAIVVKGDLTSDGTADEFASFEACYRQSFGDRLHVVRGNHDAYRGQHEYAGDQWLRFAGVTIALLDTVKPGASNGRLDTTQIDWLDAHLREATQPVLVMGHHQQWIGGLRSDDYFGLAPDSSDALNDLAARHTAFVAYTAGHTHRHRRRHMACGVPSIEVGCVKDFPGTWAEYQVFDGGILQIVHRVSSPAALRWSERCRALYSDFGVDYVEYALGRLDDRCFVIPLR